MRPLVPVLLAVSAAGLAACAGSPQAAPPIATTGSSTTSVPTPPITSATVSIGGHRYAVPTEDGVHPIDSEVDSGSQIILTDKGFLPYRLLVQLGQHVTWTNLSSHPVRIRFLHMSVLSGLIPVGGTFGYSSNTLVTFEYTSSSGYHGVVSIGAFTGS